MPRKRAASSPTRACVSCGESTPTVSAKQILLAPAASATSYALTASSGSVRLVSSTVKRTFNPRRTASRVTSPMRRSASSRDRPLRVASERGETPIKIPTQSAPTSAAASTSEDVARAWQRSGVCLSTSRTALMRTRSVSEIAGWPHSTVSTPRSASNVAISALARAEKTTPGAWHPSLSVASTTRTRAPLLGSASIRMDCGPLSSMISPLTTHATNYPHPMGYE